MMIQLHYEKGHGGVVRWSQKSDGVLYVNL